VHQLYDGEPKILVDKPVLELLGSETLERIRERREEFQTPGAIALRAHVVLRSRFAEDRLAEAVARGVRQYVILGAGGDTFAYRQPAWASELAIFEVDHDASQTAKRARLAHAGVIVPPNVIFAPIDFERTTLRDGLLANGVDLSAPVFFSWLGVTMYLTETAVDAVLRTVASLPPSTEIVFTYARQRAPDEHREGPTLAERAAAVGEPWLTYFEPEPLEVKLRSFGFDNVHFLTVAAARDAYFRDRTDQLVVPARVSIVSAAV
jgi:methyltransferase (TIGR00027 family)